MNFINRKPTTLERFFAAFTVFSLVITLIPISARAQQPEVQGVNNPSHEEVDDPEITICHATRSNTHPYDEQSPSVEAILAGHDDHDGPVWFDGTTEAWGDIIPPFEYDGGSYAGKNWTTEGQAIWNDGCGEEDDDDGDDGEGMITVDKVVVGTSEVSGDDFNLWVGNKKVGDNEPEDIDAGTYTVTETPKDGVPTNYTTTFSGACDAEGQVTIGDEEEKTCVVTNTYTTDDPSDDTVATIVAQKLVCTNEADIPNSDDWAALKPIDSTTATEWIATHPSCDFVSGWNFEWVKDSQQTDPGDTLTGPAGAPWTTFGSTNGSGMTSVTLTDEQVGDADKVWLREVLKPGYIPFSNEAASDNSNDITAGFYCNTDVLNYDNWEWIDNMETGETYHCVAWNMLVDEPDMCVPEPDGGWADTVEEYDQANRKDGSAITDPNRTDPAEALGEEDWDAGDSTGFFSLGFGGWIIVGFDSYVPNVDGNDISIHEATNGTYPAETAKIEVSQNGTTWYEVGTANNASLDKVTYFDFDATGLEWIKFVRITDTSNPALHTNDADGFDLDAIDATETVCTPPGGGEPTVCTVTLVSGLDENTDDIDDATTVVEKGGAAARVLSTINGAWTATIAGAQWIWGDDPVAPPVDGVTQNFIRKFGWNGPVTNAKLTIAADNTFAAEINGDAAGSDLTEFNYVAPAKEYDVTSLIDQGNNELAVEVQNMIVNPDPAVNPAGLLYKLEITGTDEECDMPYEEEEPKMCLVVSNASTLVEGASSTLTFVHPAWTTTLATGTAKWIWDNTQEPQDGETLTFTKTFNVDNAPTGATLRVAADNRYTATLNGNPLSCDGSGSDNFTAIDTCSAPVVAGMNTLVFEATNDPYDTTDPQVNPAGLIYELTIDGSSCSPVVTPPDTGPYAMCLTPNLLANGSFEDEVVTDPGLWEMFASVTGWVTTKVADASAAMLEHHRGWSQNEASEGLQYAELDGEESTRITQDVVTEDGAVYKLWWSFAPRQDTVAGENLLSVLVDGTEVASTGPMAGIGVLDSEDWVRESIEFTADNLSADIAFADAGTNNQVGTFLDDAYLCKVQNAPNGGNPTISVLSGGGSCTNCNDSNTRGDSRSSTNRNERNSRDDIEEEDLPDGEVEGAQVSILPIGAPNAGSGGASRTPYEVLPLLAALGFVASQRVNRLTAINE